MILFDPPSLESLLLPTCIGNSTIDSVITVDDPLVILALPPMPSKRRADRTLWWRRHEVLYQAHVEYIHVISPDFMLTIGRKMMAELPSFVCLAMLKKVHNSRTNSGPPRGSYMTKSTLMLAIFDYVIRQ